MSEMETLRALIAKEMGAQVPVHRLPAASSLPFCCPHRGIPLPLNYFKLPFTLFPCLSTAFHCLSTAFQLPFTVFRQGARIDALALAITPKLGQPATPAGRWRDNMLPSSLLSQRLACGCRCG